MKIIGQAIIFIGQALIALFALIALTALKQIRTTMFHDKDNIVDRYKRNHTNKCKCTFCTKTNKNKHLP